MIYIAKEFSRRFYNSSAWVNTSKAYKNHKFGICEKCGGVGEEVHHIIPLSPNNINDPLISLSWDNLMLLCRSCHELIEEKAKPTIDGIVFTEDGQVVEVLNNEIKDTY